MTRLAAVSDSLRRRRLSALLRGETRAVLLGGVALNCRRSRR